MPPVTGPPFSRKENIATSLDADGARRCHRDKSNGLLHRDWATDAQRSRSAVGAGPDWNKAGVTTNHLGGIIGRKIITFSRINCAKNLSYNLSYVVKSKDWRPRDPRVQSNREERAGWGCQRSSKW